MVERMTIGKDLPAHTFSPGTRIKVRPEILAIYKGCPAEWLGYVVYTDASGSVVCAMDGHDFPSEWDPDELERVKA